MTPSRRDCCWSTPDLPWAALTKPLIIITEHLDDVACDWLSQRADVHRMGVDDTAFAEHLARAAGVVVRTYTKVDEPFLDGAPNLRVVGRAGVGLDNIDVEVCEARGIAVVHTPDANTQAVVEYVVSILGAAMRPLHPLSKDVDADTWDRLRTEAMAARQLSQMTLGIVGLGRIGSRVAQVAAAIGMSVQYCDLRDIAVDARHGADPVDLETLLRGSDVVSVHVDGRATNRHLLGQDALTRLPEHAMLINTARGFVIDHTALAAVLGHRPAMRAVLDVHDPEPVPPGHALLDLPNAVLLPHAASRTHAAQAAMSWVVRDVARVLGLMH